VFFVFLNHLFRKNPSLFPQMMAFYSTGLAVVFAWAVYRYWQYGWNPMVVKGIFQPFYRDYTIFGATTALTGMYWFVIAGGLKPASFKMVAYTVAMVFISAVIVSASRAAALSLVFGVIVLVMLRLRLHIRHLAMLALVSVLLIIAARSAIRETLLQNTYVSRSHDLEWGSNIKSAGNITTDVSNLERLNRWYSGIKMFLEKPLTGFGPGTYQFAYIPYQKKELMNRLTVTNPWNIPENSGGTAHSEYILALSEMGLIGFLCLILLFGRLVWIAFTKVRTHPERHLIVVAFAALSTYFFHSFFNNFLNTDKFAFLFWGMAAWLMALNQQDHERELLPEG
jgi:putative inorganic carbon (hco3(-)) transporter